MIARRFTVVKWLFISLAALALSASACWAQNAGQPCPAGGYAAAACPIITDQVIQTNVSARLAGAVTTPDMPISVQVCGGVVTLVGPVADQRRKELANFLAQSVRGVLLVRNMLVLSGPTALDLEIVRAVREALQDQPYDTNQVRVFADNGVVELRGEVESDIARTSLGLTAEGVTGVKAVHNNLIVNDVAGASTF